MAGPTKQAAAGSNGEEKDAGEVPAQKAGEVQFYRVEEDIAFPSRGGKTKLTKGKIISSKGYDIGMLVDEIGVKLKPVPEPGWHKKVIAAGNEARKQGFHVPGAMQAAKVAAARKAAF